VAAVQQNPRAKKFVNDDMFYQVFSLSK